MGAETTPAVMRWFTRRHPGVGGITSGEADALEAAASARVIELVPATIEGAGSGRCADCGAETAPWFSRCDPCQARAQAGGVPGGRPQGGADRAGRPPSVPPNRATRRHRARRG